MFGDGDEAGRGLGLLGWAGVGFGAISVGVYRPPGFVFLKVEMLDSDVLWRQSKAVLWLFW